MLKPVKGLHFQDHKLIRLISFYHSIQSSRHKYNSYENFPFWQILHIDKVFHEQKELPILNEYKYSSQLSNNFLTKRLLNICTGTGRHNLLSSYYITNLQSIHTVELIWISNKLFKQINIQSRHKLRHPSIKVHIYRMNILIIILQLNRNVIISDSLLDSKICTINHKTFIY
jgi:hypothetical protein